MDADALRDFLAQVAAGTVTPDEAVAVLRRLPFADLGFARVDHHRSLRRAWPEAVYAPGKTPAQCAGHRGSGSCSPRPAPGPVSVAAADAGRWPRPWPRTAGKTGRGPVLAGETHATVVWRPMAPSGASGCGRDRRHRRPARGRRVRRHPRRPRAPPRCASPTSAWPVCTACSPRVDELPAPMRGGGGRHGGRVRQRGRRAHGGAGGGGARPAPATAPRSKASPRCSP